MRHGTVTLPTIWGQAAGSGGTPVAGSPAAARLGKVWSPDSTMDDAFVPLSTVPELHDRVRSAMLEMSESEALGPVLKEIFGGSKLLAGAPASYSALRDLLDRSSGVMDAYASTTPPDS